MSRLKLPMSSLTLTLALAGCLGEDRSSSHTPREPTAEEIELARARPALDEKRIEQFGFQLSWDAHLDKEQLTALCVEGDQLYAYTRSHRIYQIDLHSGMVNWMHEVGRPLSFAAGGRPIAEWTYSKDERGYKKYDEIYFVAKDVLVALDKRNGSELFTVPLTFTPSGPPEAGDSHVYIGSWDDRIYALSKEDPRAPGWFWRTDGDVLTRPVFASPNVFVSSSDGTLYGFKGDSGQTLEPFKTQRRLRFDPIQHGTLLYVPSDDHNLYVIGRDDGLVHHRYCAGSPITSTPVVVGRPAAKADDKPDIAVYVTAEGKGLVSLRVLGRPKDTEGNPNKVSHKELWTRAGADAFLCRGVGAVYLREGKDTISKVDAEKGHFRDSLKLEEGSFAPVDFWVSNPFHPQDALNRDRALRGGVIVLGYRNGWIVALKEKATIPGALPAGS